MRHAKHIQIDPVTPDSDMIDRAAKIIQTGGTVIFPTRGLYGLGADACNASAVERVWRIKQRPTNKPILVLIAAQQQLASLVTDISPAAKLLMAQFWPGNLTLLFSARAGLPQPLISDSGKIGIRLAAHPVARALIRACGGPITATSANFSGHPGCWQSSDMDLNFVDRADLWLDAGNLQGGIPSTVVDVTATTATIVRQGVIAPNRIANALTPKKLHRSASRC